MKIVTNLHHMSRPTTPVKYDGQMPSGAIKLIRYLQTHRRDAVGISANQLGIDQRVCAFWDGVKITVLVNPEIIGTPDTTIHTSLEQEGCLSLPKKSYDVIRWSWVNVKADNHISPLLYNGWTARVVQHEIDHLDGITIKDRASEVDEETNALMNSNYKTQKGA